MHELITHFAPAMKSGEESANKSLRKIIDTNWIRITDLHVLNNIIPNKTTCRITTTGSFIT